MKSIIAMNHSYRYEHELGDEYDWFLDVYMATVNKLREMMTEPMFNEWYDTFPPTTLKGEMLGIMDKKLIELEGIHSDNTQNDKRKISGE